MCTSGSPSVYLSPAHNRTTDVVVASVASAYVLLALRIATRKAMLDPERLLVVGMFTSRLRRGEIFGVSVTQRGGLRGSSSVVLGLDRTGLGRPLWTVRFANVYEMHAFVQALNAWCGYDGESMRRQAQARTVTAMETAALNLKRQAAAKRAP